jgi:hypothetical protein
MVTHTSYIGRFDGPYPSPEVSRWHSGVGCANAYDQHRQVSSNHVVSQPDFAAFWPPHCGCRLETRPAAPAARDQRRQAVAKQVQPFQVLTSNTVAFNTVDLVARRGLLASINTDGGFDEGRHALRDRADHVQAKVREIWAGRFGQAQLLNAQAEFTRRRRCCAGTSRRRTPMTRLR